MDAALTDIAVTVPRWMLWIGFISASVSELVVLVTGVLLVRGRGQRNDPNARLAARARQEAEAGERRLMRAIHREARRLERIIPHHMYIQNKLGSEKDELNVMGGRRKVRAWIRFEATLLTRTEIWYRVDGKPEKMPHGVGFYDLLYDKKLIPNLEYGIQRPCRWYRDEYYNVFLRVNLRNAIMGIPKRIEWSSIYHLLGKTRYAVPVGVNEYSRLVWEDFRRWPHLLVAGATQQGKSTWLIQAIVSLLRRNSPQQLQFIFVDLKDGLEMARFSTMPHTRQFIQEPEDVAGMLAALHKEYKSRVRKFRERGVQNIRGWNATAAGNEKMPYIILIVDELADIMLDRQYKNAAVDWSVKLARKARAAGIHLWYCTQIIEAKVLEIQIRGNFPARIAFNMAGFDESRLVVGNGMAYGLETEGRCVYQFGANHNILQSPIATTEEVNFVIDAAINNAPPEAEPPEPLDVLRKARDNYKGECRWRDLWAEFEGDFSSGQIKEILKAYQYVPEEQQPVVTLDGVSYILVQGRGGLPTRMVTITPDTVLPGTYEDAKKLAWETPWDDQIAANNQPDDGQLSTLENIPEDDAWDGFMDFVNGEENDG